MLLTSLKRFFTMFQEREVIIIEDSEGEEDSGLQHLGSLPSHNNAAFGQSGGISAAGTSPSIALQQGSSRIDSAAGRPRSVRQLYSRPAATEDFSIDEESMEARRRSLAITGKAVVAPQPEVKPETSDPNTSEPTAEEMEALQLRMACDRQFAMRLQHGEGSSSNTQFARDLLVYACQRLEQQLLQGVGAQHDHEQEQQVQDEEAEEVLEPAAKKRRTKSAAAAAAAGTSTASGSTKSAARVQPQQQQQQQASMEAAELREPAADSDPSRPQQRQQQRQQPAAAAAQRPPQQRKRQRGQPPRPDTAGTEFAAKAQAAARAAADSGSDAHGPREEQRQLRSKLSLMERVMEDRKEELRDSSRRDLAEVLEQLKDLGKRATRPREAAQHAGVENCCFEEAVDMIRSFASHAAGRHPSQLLRAIKASFALISPSDGPTPINWEALGEVSSGLFRTAPGLGSMLGALEAKAKPRKQSVRRARQAPGPEVRPLQGLQAMDTQEGMSQETQRVVTEMKRVLERVGSCSWMPLVLDHDSFAHTVENVFALSFLTKDMWVRLDCDSEAGLMVRDVSRQEQERLKEQHRAAAAAQGGGHRGPQQFMLNLDMGMWASMKQLVAPQECLMPQRPIHKH